MEPEQPYTPVDGERKRPPTAFVSYAQGDDAWNALVLEFAFALREPGGVESDVDAWHLASSEDWATFGPRSIDTNDFTLLPVSQAYKEAWEGTTEISNPGAFGEISALKALMQQDRQKFRSRVRVVLLPGVGPESVPAELRSWIRRFEVKTFDLPGLEMLLRSIYGKERYLKPQPAAQPKLPAMTIAELRASRGRRASRTPERVATDAEIKTLFASRAEKIDRDIAAAVDDDVLQRLRWERRTLQANLDALEPTLGIRRQEMVGDLLVAQLYLSAGAHQAAEQSLSAVLQAVGRKAADPAEAALEPCLRELAKAMLALNRKTRDQRYASGSSFRHPGPPKLDLEPARTWSMTDYYECVRFAMKNESAEAHPRAIRKAILRGRTPEDEHADRLYHRCTDQQWIAHRLLDIAEPSKAGYAGAAHLLRHSDLENRSDRVATDVLHALVEAHLGIHGVERRRSVPIGRILARSAADIKEDERRLRRSIVLNTYALSITESLPWIFASAEAEREDVVGDAATARRDLSPFRAMWPARQVTLLALYRRSHGFRLLGDHERAYHDLRMLQRVGRLTRWARPKDDFVTGWVDTLEALAEYRIGELYRVDHDYMQALVHLCRSHDAVRNLVKRPDSAVTKELGHLEIKLSLGKGKAFFEIGSVKRSLKWHLNAWRWLLAMDAPDEDLARDIAAIEDELDRAKHDPVLYKDYLQDKVGPLLHRMCDHELATSHNALEADILARISHLMMVLRLPQDESGVSDADSAALRCLKRAAERDDRSLSVKTGLLRYELRRGDVAGKDALPPEIAGPTIADPLKCWPAGETDVDKVIRAAEHLMLERVYATFDTGGRGKQAVAQKLMAHFTTHTDSINLRGAILHRYLMRRRVEERRPWHETSDDGAPRPAAPDEDRRQYLEFVCLRRFGSFTPFMPRPAAVSAVGGGYLARIVRPACSADDGATTMFNIVVDPGEGAVNNLYAMGLSIADIDMVVATHDHPEHLSALDAILRLRKELRDRAGDPVRTGSTGPQRLLILGNRSVVNRYSFLNGDARHLVLHIADAEQLRDSALTRGLTFTPLETKHQDLGGADAVGFTLGFQPDGSDERLTITFTADTAIDALRSKRDPAKLDRAWELALASDVVIAHVSDIPSGELREVALPSGDKADALTGFYDRVEKFVERRPEIASRLKHALSLGPSDGAPAGRDQLYLSGLLEVCARMSESPPVAGGGTRLLIVGELREQLGSFRGTIAREINYCMLDLPAVRKNISPPPLFALTADIGLRIRLALGGTKGRSRVLCSTCSYNNDRLDLERFHPPHQIYEVCVKGDHEGIYWNCILHDPGTRQRPMFIEQMGGYNPFAAGGRYHG